jgi:D-beta-D-heptose 7-phosphate kinase/D-beta-D-heptose 1-phosphate adenosyltransferase
MERQCEAAVGQVVTQDELILRVAEAKRNARRVVFTNGCFDLLHPGHIRGFEAARAMGDVLVVAVNSDASVRALKGPDRPVLPQEERAEILAALAAVDYVVIFDELTPRELITRVLPDVLAKGGDWGPNEIVGREEVEAAGGRVVSVAVLPGYSTSSILERIRSGTSSS